MSRIYCISHSDSLLILKIVSYRSQISLTGEIVIGNNRLISLFKDFITYIRC